MQRLILVLITLLLCFSSQIMKWSEAGLTRLNPFVCAGLLLIFWGVLNRFSLTDRCEIGPQSLQLKREGKLIREIQYTDLTRVEVSDQFEILIYASTQLVWTERCRSYLGCLRFLRQLIQLNPELGDKLTGVISLEDLKNLLN